MNIPNEPLPPLPPPQPNSSWLARLYVENKVLFDRLLVVIIGAVLSYLGYDKLNVIETKADKIEQKADTAADKALIAAEKAEAVEGVALKTRVDTAKLLADRTGNAAPVAVAEEKLETYQAATQAAK